MQSKISHTLLSLTIFYYYKILLNTNRSRIVSNWTLTAIQQNEKHAESQTSANANQNISPASFFLGGRGIPEDE